MRRIFIYFYYEGTRELKIKSTKKTKKQSNVLVNEKFVKKRLFVELFRLLVEQFARVFEAFGDGRDEVLCALRCLGEREERGKEREIKRGRVGRKRREKEGKGDRDKGEGESEREREKKRGVGCENND
jgi:hypothetical protein